MRNLTLLSLCIALFLLRTSYANQKLVVFGDSLSDNGRLFATTGFPPEPYGHTYGKSGKDLGYTYPGRFTDGQNWVDYLPTVANSFGVVVPAVTPFLEGPQYANDNGTNFAVGGATSGNVNVLSVRLGLPLPGFQAQISTYLNSLHGQASADDLYVIWIGANDFSAGIQPAQTVANIKNGIATLSDKGARAFVVINVPDLSLTPHVKALGGATILAAKRFVFTTNVLLEVELLRFAFLHRISIELVDINAIFIPVVYNPGRFGFTYSTGFALAALAANPNTNSNDYVFWDDFHPTTKVHNFAAELIFKTVFLRHRFNEFLSVR